ncbi:MAG: lipoyl(octanoyl) transferase LipB [Betaproteobacteria bacterium]|nr:lipoyl(octanoyl) transferase LipB [Betaproteobacteria bacterium]
MENEAPSIIHMPGLVEYTATWQAMQDFTAQRSADTPDELWLLQHPPIYTLGQAGLTEHMHQPNAIPLIHTDRGGQITYHGPGQWVVYLLIDLRRRGYGVRELVWRMEQTIIDLLGEYGITAQRREHAPGVYADGAKIASLGLRVRHGCSYHGLALNTDMDLTPFNAIHPCGYRRLRVTQLRDLVDDVTMEHVAQRLLGHLTRHIVAQPERQDSRG